MVLKIHDDGKLSQQHVEAVSVAPWVLAAGLPSAGLHLCSALLFKPLQALAPPFHMGLLADSVIHA